MTRGWGVIHNHQSFSSEKNKGSARLVAVLSLSLRFFGFQRSKTLTKALRHRFLYYSSTRQQTNRLYLHQHYIIMMNYHQAFKKLIHCSMAHFIIVKKR